MDQLKKVFPQYMQGVSLPKEATEEEITVFRICKTGKVEPDSFLTSYVDYSNSGNLNQLDLSEAGAYSISCWEKERDARRSLTFFTKRSPIAIGSTGITKSQCGVIQRTRERKGKNAKSHIDWWVYEGAEPHLHFAEVALNEKSQTIF